MASTNVIVPHGTTPSGFGLRIRSNGKLRPISKCCGRTMETRCICKGCNTSYEKESASLHAALDVDIAVPGDSITHGIVEAWVQRLTGLPDAKLEVGT